MINFFHVYIKRRPDHLEPAIELNISESDLKKNIVNTCRGYPVVSFGCGGF